MGILWMVLYTHIIMTYENNPEMPCIVLFAKYLPQIIISYIYITALFYVDNILSGIDVILYNCVNVCSLSHCMIKLYL